MPSHWSGCFQAPAQICQIIPHLTVKHLSATCSQEVTTEETTFSMLTDMLDTYEYDMVKT
jgi:hypothetical protein